MSRTTANTPVPHLGQPGALTLQQHAAQVTTRTNASLELHGALLGGPDFYGGNLGQREENAAGFDVAGSHLGQHVRAYPGEHLELLSHQSPLTLTSILAADAGATIHRKRGALLKLRREHRGGGVVKDQAALLRFEDEYGEGNLIEDQWGLFVVDKNRKLFAPAASFDELWVAGVPVLSLLTGGGTPTSDFEDGEFSIYDGLDNTKVASFVANSITTATTRLFTFPDQSGTLALTSDLAALGAFADNAFELYDVSAPTARARFDCEDITAGNTRVFYFPDADGQLALLSDVPIDHDDLAGLGDDDHTQYLLLAGRGGQSVADELTLAGGAVSTSYSARRNVTGSGTTHAPLVFEPSDPADNGAAGDGWKIPFMLENDASAQKEAGLFVVGWIDPSAGAEHSYAAIYGLRAGNPTLAFSCDFSNQQVWLADEVFDFSGMANEDLLVRRSGTWQRIPVGAEGDVLTVVGGQVAWAAP